MADYNSKSSVLKPIRVPIDIYKWLMGLKPRNKDFSAKVIGILRDRQEVEK